MKTILAAIDFSETSDAVIAETAALAKATGGRVVLLTVVQPPVIATEYAPFVENVAEIAAAADKAATRRLAGLQQRLAAEQVPAETVQLSGPPVGHIVNEAKRRNADYLVLGSHGHNAFYDLLVGSTAHGVLLRASCPVIIVPTRKRPPAA